MSNCCQKFGVSVVVPVYNSAKTLCVLYDRVAKQLNFIAEDNWEIILVDDASSDGSWDILCSLHDKDSRVKCIRFAHNQGQQSATLCGMNYASKDCLITIDDDLQCYPEDIPKFIEQQEKGMAVVIGKIAIRNKHHSWWRNLGSGLNQYMIGKALGKPDTLHLSSFRAMALPIAKKLTQYRGASPHIAAMLLNTVPHNLICNVDIQHAPRLDGKKTTYSLAKLVKTLVFLVINYSYIPLRLMTGWGIMVSLLSITYAFGILFVTLFGDRGRIPGWASLAILLSFLSGNILLALGILGEYVGRLVENSSRVEQFSVFEERL